MIENILTAIAQYAIPQEYMPLAVICLTFWIALENWLASTHRLQANSTIQLLTNVAKRLLKKNETKEVS